MIKSPIYHDNKLVGWRLYKTGGIFGTLTFVGYEWN